MAFCRRLDGIDASRAARLSWRTESLARKINAPVHPQYLTISIHMAEPTYLGPYSSLAACKISLNPRRLHGFLKPVLFA